MPQTLVFDQNYHLQRELRANNTNVDNRRAIPRPLLRAYSTHSPRHAP